MPNTKEKLIELMCDASYDITRICVNRDYCDGCPAEYGEGRCNETYIADHILASDFINELQNEAYDLGVDSILRHKFGLSWDDAAGLRKEIKRLQDATKWIPVTERLPELETYTYSVDVLFSDYEEGIHVGYVCLETGTWKDKYSRKLYAKHKVTHWMPLPEPPKGEWVWN